MFGTGASKECKDNKRQGYHKCLVVRGLELAQVLGMDTMCSVGWSGPTETEAVWGCISISVGPRQKKRGRQDQKQRGKLRQIFLQVLR